MLIATQTQSGARPRAVGRGTKARWSEGRTGILRTPSTRVAGLVSAVVVILGTPPSHADIQLPAKVRTKGERQVQAAVQAPLPFATTAHVEPGGSVEIVLHATGGAGKMVDFLLRTPPLHGGFEGEMRRVDRDSVIVTYAHRAGDGAIRDEFTFATQANGTPVSAAATVTIEVGEVAAPAPAATSGSPDVAATPTELDFGAVDAGRSTGATLTLENRGGATAHGHLDLPAPWTVDGGGIFELPAGARGTFHIVFRPTEEGAFSQTLRIDPIGFASTTGCVVQLIGTGLQGRVRQAASPVPAIEVASTPAATAPASLPSPPAAAAPATPAPVASSEVHALPGANDPAPGLVNEATVTGVRVRAVTSSSIELSWRPPVPLPRSYRIERRTFAADDRAQGGVRIDWLPYARTDFKVHADEVTATLRGFVPADFVTVRVVSVDSAGRLSEPSPLIDVMTTPGPTWLRPTPLKGLLLALAVCLALIARRRWQWRQLAREIEERRAAEQDSSLEYAPRS